MYNLIQIQDAIKNVPLKDVMDYANGKSPNVPSYLALAELNRRKQIQETSDAFYGQPQDLKTQIESSLTQAPKGVDITKAPAGIDITQTPPQLSPNLPPVGQVQPGAAPQGQVNPAAAPPVLAARGGMMRSHDIARGLASIPVSQFKRANFATGGIIAFADGGDVVYDPVTGVPMYGEQTRQDGRSGVLETLGLGNPENRRVLEEMEANRRARENPNVQQSATSSGQIPPSAPPAERPRGIASVAPSKPAAPTTPPPPSIAERIGTGIPTEEETQAAIDRQRKLQAAYGVSQDPYADVRRRYAEIEKRRDARREEEPMDRLMATLAAYSEAAPEKGLGYQLGQAGKARAALIKEQEALKDKQDMEMAGLYNSMAKEEDARKRGDMKEVEAQLTAQKNHKIKIIELENQAQQAQAHTMSAQAQMMQAQRGPTPAAEMQIIQGIMRDKGVGFTEAMQIASGLKGMAADKRQADKDWNEKPSLRIEWEDKGGYPAYMASKGITVPGAQQAGGPKEGDRATSKSGKPIIFRNGKWEYQ